MYWNLIKAKGLKGDDSVLRHWLGKNVVPACSFLAVVVEAGILRCVCGGFGRVSSDVMPFTFSDGFAERRYITNIGVKVGANDGRYVRVMGEL